MVTVRQNGEVIGEVDTSDYRTGQVGRWTLDEVEQLPDKWRIVKATHEFGSVEWYVVRDADPLKAIMSGGATGSIQEGADQIGDVSDLTSSRHGFSSQSEARTAYEAFSGRDLSSGSGSSTSSSSASGEATSDDELTIEEAQSDGTISATEARELGLGSYDDETVESLGGDTSPSTATTSNEDSQPSTTSTETVETASTDPQVTPSEPSTTVVEGSARPHDPSDEASTDSGGTLSGDGLLSDLSTKQKAAIGALLGSSALYLGGGL